MNVSIYQTVGFCLHDVIQLKASNTVLKNSDNSIAVSIQNSVHKGFMSPASSPSSPQTPLKGSRLFSGEIEQERLRILQILERPCVR